MRRPTNIQLWPAALLLLLGLPITSSAQQEADAGMVVYLKQKIRTQLVQTYPDSTHRYEIQLKRLPHNLRSVSKNQIEEVSYAGRGMPTGYSTFDIYYRTGNRDTQSKAQFFVKVWKKLPVPQERIQKEEPISPDDLTYRWVELATDSQAYLADISEVEGYVASRMIKEGRPLQKSHLSKPMVVEGGDRVTMSLHNGALKLSIECIARQSGPKGESIRVYSQQTRKTYSAVVVEEGKVRWVKTL